MLNVENIAQRGPLKNDLQNNEKRHATYQGMPMLIYILPASVLYCVWNHVILHQVVL